jgi:short-subunit dehydrogenase
LSGVIALTHAFLPDLIARPAGHIVNIASAAAVIALPMATSYAASKWAVLGFSDSLREELRELGHRHVGVTAVCPGYIATGLFDGARPSRLTRWLTPEEVAAAVVRAVERGHEFVMLPRSTRTMYRLCAGLPRSWFRAICRALGVSQSMAGWKGHAPPGIGGATASPEIR